MPTTTVDESVVVASAGKATKPKRGAVKTTMSVDHKEALVVGRAEGRAVRAYLEALEASLSGRKRGRRRTPESIGARLVKIDEELPGADLLKRLLLTQERLELSGELAVMSDGGGDISSLETEFVRVAAGYARRKGVSYAAFRLLGVPAAVLKQAGISRAA